MAATSNAQAVPPEVQRHALRPRDLLPAIGRMPDGSIGEDSANVSVSADRELCRNCEAQMTPDHLCDVKPMFLDEKVQVVTSAPVTWRPGEGGRVEEVKVVAGTARIRKKVDSDDSIV